MNLNFAIIKDYQDKSFKELKDAPINALKGVSENDAKLLQDAFQIKTIGDFANLKYVQWTQSISTLADTEE